MALNNHITQTSLDSKGLAELRRSATADQKDQETLRQVAGQFESLFINMMLKSMRQASLADGIFDSSQSDMYRDLSDQQLAVDLSTKGGLGLQDVIMRQLGGDSIGKRYTGGEATAYDISTISVRPALTKQIAALATQVQTVINTENEPTAASEITSDSATPMTFNSPAEFVQQLWPMAKQAADRIGVSPEVILSQAALETGWGKHVIKQANGESSHNLFNIKADSRWTGEKASVSTLEYRHGVAAKEQANFRSYDSYQQSFDDYVDFLQTQPRYQNALDNASDPEKFVEELHKSGYATDPDYADKIKRIMNGVTLAQISQQPSYS